jgi:methylglutaconyl-CoA hydratase
MTSERSLQAVNVEIDARGVARLMLARANVRNAFDEVMIAELTECLSRFATDSTVRCVLLCAEGTMFCSGADIGWMQRQSQNSDVENLIDARRFAEMMRALYDCPKPVIARVQGRAFGGGVGLMAAADIVIAAREAQFAITEAKFGILPSVIGPYLVKSLGARQALRLAITTTRFTADEAVTLGLAHESVAIENLDAAVDRTVRAVLSSGPNAIREAKMLFHQLAGAIDDQVRELTAGTIARVRSNDEAREGFAAFLEKRTAAWAPA